MRINLSIDRYDIVSLDEIYKTAQNFEKKAEILEMLGIMINKKIVAAGEEFDSKNYERVMDATADYLQKMSRMRDDLMDLTKSCHELAEKMSRIFE